MPSKTFKPAKAFDEGIALAIDMQTVESDQIAAIGHCADTKTLAVTFKRGQAVYQYPNVDRELFDKFAAAESKGEFFAFFVKPLPFRKYRVEAAPA